MPSESSSWTEPPFLLWQVLRCGHQRLKTFLACGTLSPEVQALFNFKATSLEVLKTQEYTTPYPAPVNRRGRM